MSETERGGLPPQVVRFVRRHVTSAGQLDVLLLLRGSPERSWTASAVAQEVYGDMAAVAPLLDTLCAQGLLVTTPDGYRYRPKTRALAKSVEELADAYTRMRHRVIRAIYEAPDPAVSFSEAFRVRKRDD
jgi:DNA-binding IclR family transcriptional regulator